MAQPNKVWVSNNSKLVKEPTIEVNEEVSYNSDTVSPETVLIMSLLDAQVKVTGTVTGTVYIFPRAGSKVEVDSRDKDEILNKKRGRSCCGGTSGKPLFELV